MGRRRARSRRRLWTGRPLGAGRRPGARSRPRPGRDHARPGQRAYPPRAVLSARAGAAGSSFVAWIRAVMAARREYPDPQAPTLLDAVDRGIAEAVRSGTAIVGDISNTLVTFDRLARSPLAAVIFYELIGFRAPDPAGSGGARQPADRGALADRSRSCQPGRARAVLGRAAGVAGDPARAGSAIRSRPAACTWRSRVRKSSSSARAADRGGNCSRTSACGIRRGRRPVSVRFSIWMSTAFSTGA